MDKVNKFRLDINGLRFIAVAGVVLFHFKFSFLSAGYAGVDVFFVISGYLMHEIIKNTPITRRSVFDFYHRRIKRVYPALFVSIAMFSLLSVLINPPSILKVQLKEALSALGFISNLFYWKNTASYFSAAVDSFFLLHTWSLGVEFQFYLLFPIVLFFVGAFKVHKSIVFGFISLMSFLLCIYISIGHASASFYLFPFRAWELFLGAFASSLKIKNKYNKITEVFSLVGIILFFIFFSSQQPWPNVNALIPALLTALILHAKVENNNVTTRHPALQKIGLWSYSIYLYHWPIYSLLYLQGIALTPFLKIFGIVMSGVLGAVSYHFIEKGLKFDWKKYLISALALCITLSILSFTSLTSYFLKNEVVQLDKMSNYSTRSQFGINKGKLCFLTSTYNSIKYFNFDQCTITSNEKPNLLLLGDSHAAQFSKSLNNLAKNFNIIQITASGCPAVINSTGVDYCTELMNFAYKKFIKEHKIQTIILASDWSLFYKNNKNLDDKISHTLDYLSKYIDHVYVISQTKHFEPNMYRLLQIYGAETDINNNRDVDLDVVHEHINGAAIGHVIDIYNYGCEENKCLFYSNNVPMFFDDNHFTLEWADRITNDIIIPLINRDINLPHSNESRKKVSAFPLLKNLFDKNSSVWNKSISWDDGMISESDKYAITGLIPIKHNEPFIISSDTNALCFYDANRHIIRGVSIHVGKAGDPITPPENARFIQFQVTPEVRIASLMVTEGTQSPKGFIPYKNEYNQLPAYGKNVIWLGDSITYTDVAP